MHTWALDLFINLIIIHYLLLEDYDNMLWPQTFKKYYLPERPSETNMSTIYAYYICINMHKFRVWPQSLTLLS